MSGLESELESWQKGIFCKCDAIELRKSTIEEALRAAFPEKRAYDEATETIRKTGGITDKVKKDWENGKTIFVKLVKLPHPKDIKIGIGCQCIDTETKIVSDRDKVIISS